MKEDIVDGDREILLVGWGVLGIYVTTTSIKVAHGNGDYNKFISDKLIVFPKVQAKILVKLLAFLKAHVKPFKGITLTFFQEHKAADPQIIIKNMNEEQRKKLVDTLNKAKLKYKRYPINFH